MPGKGFVDSSGKSIFASIENKVPSATSLVGQARQVELQKITEEARADYAIGVADSDKPFVGAKPFLMQKPRMATPMESARATKIAIRVVRERIARAPSVQIQIGEDARHMRPIEELLKESSDMQGDIDRSNTLICMARDWLNTFPWTKNPERKHIHGSLLIYIGTPSKYLSMCLRSNRGRFDSAYADNRLIILCRGACMLPLGTQEQNLFGVHTDEVIDAIIDAARTRGDLAWSHGAGTKAFMLQQAMGFGGSQELPPPETFATDNSADLVKFDYLVRYQKYLNEVKMARPNLPLINFYDTGLTVSVLMGAMAVAGVSQLMDSDGLAMIRDASIGHIISKLNQLVMVQTLAQHKAVYNFWIGDGACRLNGGMEVAFHLMEDYSSESMITLFVFNNYNWAIEDNLVADTMEQHTLCNAAFYNMLSEHENVCLCENDLELREAISYLTRKTDEYVKGKVRGSFNIVVVRGLDMDLPPVIGDIDPIRNSPEMAFMRRVLGHFADGCKKQVPLYGCSAFEYVQFLDIFLKEYPEGKRYQYVCGRTDIQAAHMCGYHQPEGKCVLFINDVYGINSLGESLRMLLNSFSGKQLLLMIWHPSLIKVIDHFHLHRPPLVWPSIGPELCKYYVRNESDAMFTNFAGEDDGLVALQVESAFAKKTPLVVVNMLPEQERDYLSLDIRVQAHSATLSTFSAPGSSPTCSSGAGSLPKLMKAAVVEEFGKPLVIKEVPVPEPGYGEVLVKVITSGVCHTDLHVRDGDWHVKPKLPIIPGHEGAGVVVKLGPGVTTLKIGDRVGHAWLHDSCGGCDYCLSGWETVCSDQHQTGFAANGCFAEYTVAQASYVGRIPDNVSFAQASPILCAGVTTYKGLKESEVKEGQWVAILGACGGLGHVGCQYAMSMGMKVCAVDFGEDKRSYAIESLKCRAYVDIKGKSNDEVVKAVKEACDGLGPHGALVLAPSTDAFRQAVDMIRPLGFVVGISLPPGDFDVDIFSLILHRKSVRGSIVGTRKDLNEALAIAAGGKVTCTVTERKFEDINTIFHEMEQGKIRGRCVLRIAPDP
jgi:alcohol dehydrogenase, propanol-preferring